MFSKDDYGPADESKVVVSDSARRKRDKEGSKKALLDAAVAVFSELGYEATTTREIAKRAKVSEALIQRYFEGKSGLFIEVMRRWNSQNGKERVASIPIAGDLASDLEQLCAFLFRHHRNHSELIRIVLSRAIVEPELAKQVGKSIVEEDLPAVADHLRHFQNQGLIDEDLDLTQLSHCILGINFSLAFLAGEVFGFDKEQMAATGKMFAKIVAQGLTKLE